MKKITLLSFALLSIVFNSYSQTNTGGIPLGTLPPYSQSFSSAVCDTIFSFPTLVGWPAGLASDGTNLWISSYNETYLSKFSSTGVLLDTLDIPNVQNINNTGGDLEFDGTHLLFAREDDGMLFKIDIATKSIVAQFALPQNSNSDPNDFGVAWDGTYIWHTAYSPVNTLYKLDANTGAILASYPIDGGADLPLKFINGSLYTIDIFNASLIQLDTANGNTLNVIPWCLTYPLGFTLHNGHVWGLASDFTDRVYEFDTLLLSVFNSENKSEFDFTIANPASQKFELNITSKFNHAFDVSATTAQGITVYESKNILASGILTIPASSFSKGIYFIKLTSGKTTLVKKVIKIQD